MKNKTTRITLALASLLLTMTVAACGNSATSAPEDTDAPKAKTTKATTTTTTAVSTTTSSVTTADPHAPSMPDPVLYAVDIDGNGSYEYVVDRFGVETDNYRIRDGAICDGSRVVVPADEVEPFVFIEQISFTANPITVRTAQMAPITQFTDIIITPANATYQEIVFSSSNEDSVKVEGHQFFFLNEGEADVTVSVRYSGKSATLKVIVSKDAQQTVKPVTTPAQTTTEAPVTTETPTTTEPTTSTTAPSTTTTAPITSTTAPVTTDTPVTTTKPITTTKAPATTTKPITTTKPPVTTEAPHTHSYSPWTTTKDATCTTDGRKVRTCVCGDEDSEVIKATGHSYGTPKTTKEATCSATGTKTATCSKCGDEKRETIAKTDHVYGAWTLCSDYINEEATCKTCGAKTTQKHTANPETDEQLVADRVIYYINQFRAEEGSTTAEKLERMTLVAQMRSTQLVGLTASSPYEEWHSTEDLRECCAYYEYGKKNANSTYNPETGEITYDGTYYYSARISEAVGHNGWSDSTTIDNIAFQIANQIRNSSGHWSYVGSSDYSYIAVGVTEAYGYSYFAIFVSDTNQYE